MHPSSTDAEWPQHRGRLTKTIIIIVVSVLLVVTVVAVVLGVVLSRRSSNSSASSPTLTPSPSFSPSPPPFTPPPTTPPPPPYNCTGNYCGVKNISFAAIQSFVFPSYDGSKYLLNKIDPATNKTQVYVGATGSSNPTCITCVQQPGGPSPYRYHYQPAWHPSGDWIFMSVEEDSYWFGPLLISNGSCTYGSVICNSILGLIQSGVYVNMWVCSVDGTKWYRLTDYPNVGGSGYTGPAITPDGKTLVWSALWGSVFTYVPFGGWELVRADFSVVGGVPNITTPQNITPPGMNWNEPGDFSPLAGSTVLLSGSYNDTNQQGMDQYILDISTGTVVDITNTPSIWDEHGLFSPNGQRVVFVSAYPYQNESGTSTVAGWKTEVMMVDKTGTNLVQLTHFRTPGYVESGSANAAVAAWDPSGYSLQIMTLGSNFVNAWWTLDFNGPCGLCP